MLNCVILPIFIGLVAEKNFDAASNRPDALLYIAVSVYVGKEEQNRQ